MEAAKEFRVSDEDLAQVEEIGGKKAEIIAEIKKVIVGQDQVIEEILIALFCRGHCLLVGVPGLAKTLLMSTLAGIIELKFNRIQFTPGLMPSDITGTDVLEEDAGSRRRSFRFLKGPIFTNILLADEINRTPPKTQAALLHAMQEEIEIVATTTSSYQPALNKVIPGEKILQMQDLVRRVPASSHVIGYAVKLVRSSRPKGPGAIA